MSDVPLVALPGFGMSPRILQPLADEVLTLPTAGDLDAWVAELLTRLPPRCTLLGWSLGATVAMALALAQPARFERLVLVGATPRFVSTGDWVHGMAAAQFDEFAQSLQADPPGALRRFAGLQAHGDVEERRVLRELAA